MNGAFIIAEAGVNHNGSKDLAFQLVDVAVDACADAVKFQTFKAKNLVTRNTAKAKYQEYGTEQSESQYQMLKGLELDYQAHYELQEYCKERKILFLSTAFDIQSLKFLVEELKIRILKIPSGEITNGPLILEYAKTGCDLILSTGMSTMGEIEEALGVLAFGLLNRDGFDVTPSRKAFFDAYSSKHGREILKEKVTILHCTTEYPATPQEVNLRAMETIREAFGLRVGYSDHSEGISIPIAASVMGAKVIEKHFTLDKTLAGPDHHASLDPDELKTMVREIRRVELAIGDGVKVPMASELENRLIARKSLVAARGISAGESFSPENIVVKRPGTGVSPMEYWEWMGKKSEMEFEIDQIVF